MVEAVTMGAAEILLILLVSAFVAPIAYVVAQAAHAVYREHHPYSPCSPQRYASLTASRYTQVVKSDSNRKEPSEQNKCRKIS